MRELLQRIISQPTAPNRESLVKQAILRHTWQRTSRVPTFEDEFGNLWMNVGNKDDIKNLSTVFVAHMDHPGVAIDKWSEKDGKILASGTWLGGGPLKLKNQPVVVFSDQGVTGHGVILSNTVLSTDKASKPDKVVIEVMCEEAPTNGKWGACLDFPHLPNNVAEYEGCLFAKSADDLVSVCALLSAFSKPVKPTIGVLFTRLEEQGLGGTTSVLKHHLVDPEKTKIVIVEVTDFAAAHVKLGAGPVIRYGDKDLTYDVDFSRYLESLAKTYKGDQFTYQIQTTSKGTTEGDAFEKHGFHVSGLSLALKNYHNESDDHETPVPEIVSISDVEMLRDFISFIVGNE